MQRLLILMAGLVFIWMGVSVALAGPAVAGPAAAAVGSAGDAPMPAEDLYSDARLAEWSRLLREHKAEALIASVERDLRGGSPHPLAPFVWATTHDLYGRLEEAMAGADEALRGKLGALPRVYHLYQQRRYADALKPFPASSARGINDVMSLLHLSWCALNELRIPDAAEYAMRAVELAPDRFQPVWVMIDILGKDDETDRLIASRFAPVNPLGKTAAGRLVWQVANDRLWLESKYVEAPTMIGLLRSWLAEHPSDPTAKYALATNLRRADHMDEPLRLYAESIAAMPFGATASRAIGALLEAGRAEDAAALALSTSRFADGAADDARRHVAERLARGAIAVQHLGEARRILEAALDRWPNDGPLNALMARVEYDSGRYDYAAPFARRAMVASPAAPEHSTLLIDCLMRSGAAPEAVRLARQQAEGEAFEGRGDITIDWYLTRSQAFVTLSNKALSENDRQTERDMDSQRLDLLLRAVDRYPRSVALLKDLADAQLAVGKRDDAMQTVRRALRVQPWHRSSLRWLLEKVEAADKKPAADALLAELRSASPYVERLWLLSAERAGDDKAVEAFWREAVRLNPGRSWAVDSLVELLIRANRWDDARASATGLLEASRSSRTGDRTEAIRIATDVERRAAARQSLPADRVTPLLTMLEEFRNLGGPLSSYYLTRAHLAEAAGDMPGAAREMLAAADADPTWERPAKELVEKYSRFVGWGRAKLAYRRHVERDPYDGRRVAALANYHATWSGSPVEALRLCRHLKEMGSADYDRDTEAAALGTLGDDRRRFEIQYTGGRPFGATWRYVRAYDETRASALASEPASIRIDDESAVASIRREGRPLVRVAYHPLSGDPLWREIGPARVEAAYDEFGDRMTSLRLVGGPECRVAYDPRDPQRRISGIALDGVGVLNVSYDAQGNDVYDTRPDPASGLDAKAATARIKSVYFDLINALNGKDLVAVVELLPRDPAVGELERRWREAHAAAEADKSPDNVRADWNARLALASAMIERIAADPRYLAEGGEHAAVVFDQARDWNNEEGVRFAVRALLLKHRLVIDAYPDGVPATPLPGLSRGEWDSWLVWRGWLTGAVPEWGERVRELVEAARRVEQQEPLLAESGQWLPRSDLVNQGFWRRHPAASILPRALGDRVTFDAALVRFNDDRDLVVGTSAGLAVLRRGFWQWYGFDERMNRFSASMDPAEVKASSAVLSLSQDHFGVLWIGTANGLVRMAGDYEGPVQRYVTPYDGLPVPRVDRVSAYNGCAVAGTGRGLRIFGSGLPPLPGALSRASVTFTREFDVTFDVRPVDFDKLAADLEIGSERFDDGLRAEVEDGATRQPSAEADAALASLLRSLGSPRTAGKSDAELAAWLRDGYVGAKPVERLRRTLLVGSSAGVHAMTGREWVRLSDEPADDAVWEVAPSRLWLLRDRALLTMRWNGKGEASAPQRVGGQQELRSAGRLHGLQICFFRSPSRARDVGVGVLSDAGLLVYFNGHFETFNLPQGLSDRRPIVRRLTTYGKAWNVITSEGVFMFDDENVQRHLRGRVHDLAFNPADGRTFVAWGDSLGCVDRDRPETVRELGALKAQRLALDGAGGVVTHDGFKVVRFAPGSDAPQTLFDATPTVPEDARPLVFNPSILALTIDSKGRVWAASGPSLFCWTPPVAGAAPAPAKQYSMFVDARAFPSQSTYIVNVLELSGQIYAVASNESPRRYRFVPLDGGVLKLEGDAFKRLGDELEAADFFTSVTKVDEETTVLGSAAGFGLLRSGSLKSFEDLGNSSYRRLRQRPMTLWLGTRGANIGDVWLFGSSGGVAAFRRGQWFYPDRLNWMLPDQHLAAFGARHVHAVSTDGAGRIYVGTDRGLTVYDPGGGDPTSFLVSNGFEDQAFDIVNERRQREMRDLLYGTLERSPGVDPQVKSAVALRREIDRLQQDLDFAAGVGPTRGAGAAEAAEADSVTVAELREQLKAKQAQLLAEVGKLRARFPELMESLKINPRDLALKRERLPENIVLVQYIASANDLNILLSSRQLNEIIKVKVSQEELSRRVLGVVESLRRPPEQGQRYEQDVRETQLELSWLYEQLLRPIEQYLPENARVLVIPDRCFAALPMGSLIRLTADKEHFDYAAERFMLGVLHTPEQLQAALDRGAGKTDGAMILADPDGTLPEARKEAAEVSGLLKTGGEPLLGERATVEAVEAAARTVRILHLATHAVLNGQRPEKSYLVLAGGRNLDMTACMTLPFDGTRLVVLSACQTGVGSVSLEFDTLANAFGVAGVTTTVASYWRVGDEATHRLIAGFYKHLAEGKDAVESLALAQRAMINGEQGFRSPRAWAGFAVFGKP
ncbi:MAG: CHAT domain-containing protein [Phycisphaeraceae bacterium]|nr:CHAT domain-containing protein [Phycisphaeraceae bacterium]